MGVANNTKKNNSSHAAFTPILSAVKYNHVDCVRELIELGACIFVRRRDRRGLGLSCRR